MIRIESQRKVVLMSAATTTETRANTAMKLWSRDGRQRSQPRERIVKAHRACRLTVATRKTVLRKSTRRPGERGRLATKTRATKIAVRRERPHKCEVKSASE